jgi:hypothetical protein
MVFDLRAKHLEEVSPVAILGRRALEKGGVISLSLVRGNLACSGIEIRLGLDNLVGEATGLSSRPLSSIGLINYIPVEHISGT